MQYGDRVAEAGPHPVDELVRERDLGHQDQDAAARGERGLGRGEEDLGLAAARHAVQEERGGDARAERAADRVDGGRAVPRRG